MVVMLDSRYRESLSGVAKSLHSHQKGFMDNLKQQLLERISSEKIESIALKLRVSTEFVAHWMQEFSLEMSACDYESMSLDCATEWFLREVGTSLSEFLDGADMLASTK
jgi:hypothetical protein